MGLLSHLHIWHDNSGKGDSASWYLNYVLINDLQTKQKHYFICNKWLAVDKNDGLIERIIPVCGDKQKKDLFYLLKNETTKLMNDGHLWLSIFTRPPYSAFSRVERITCSFVMLFISMLINILYYGNFSENLIDDGSPIGPFYFSVNEVSKQFHNYYIELIF